MEYGGNDGIDVYVNISICDIKQDPEHVFMAGNMNIISGGDKVLVFMNSTIHTYSEITPQSGYELDRIPIMSPNYYVSIEFLVNDWPPVTWWGMVHFQKASLGSTANGKHGARIPAFFFNINKVLNECSKV